MPKLSELMAQQDQPKAKLRLSDLQGRASATSAPADHSKDALGTDGENFRAGMGKSFVDQARGALQTIADPMSMAFSPFKALSQVAAKHGAAPVFGAETKVANLSGQLKADQAEANQRDAALMGTKSGFLGNLTGYAAQFLAPGAALKAREAMAGAEASPLTQAFMPTSFEGNIKQGAVTGLTQPLATGQDGNDRIRNAVIGAGAGAAGHLIPKALGGVVRTAKAAVAPITKSGKERIIADALERFGKGGNVEYTPSAIKGVEATLPEGTGNAGFASLQRFLSGLDGNANAFNERQLQNNAARVGALRRVFGDQDTIDAATQTREQGTSGLYDLASNLDQVRAHDASAVTDAASQQAAAQAEAANKAAMEAATLRRAVGAPVKIPDPMAAPVYRVEPTPVLKSLADRPAMKSAMAQARRLAANQGYKLSDPLTSIRGIQFTKMALDQMLNANPMQSLGKFDKAAVSGIKSQLMAEAEKMSPEFATANAEFARLTKPINAMQVGQEVLAKGSSAQEDALKNPTLHPEAFARAVNNVDGIARKVTGYSGAAAQDMMAPDQLQTLRDVSSDLGRQQIGQRAGKAIGSDSVQNLASAHLLANVGSSLGIHGLQDVPIIRTVGRVLDSVYKVAGIPDELKEGLTRVVLDPNAPESKAILSKLTAPQRQMFISAVSPYLGRVSQATGISVSKESSL